MAVGIRGIEYSDSLSRPLLGGPKISTDTATGSADIPAPLTVQREGAYSIDQIFGKIDTNRDGVISKDEFVKISSDTQEEVINTMAALQPDSTESLIDLLQSIGSATPQHETGETQSPDSWVDRIGTVQADQIFSKIDKDGDGKISRDEFVEARAYILEKMKNSVESVHLKLIELLLNMFDKLGSTNTGVKQNPGTTVAQSASTQPDRDRMFKKFDTNGDGEISKGELQKGMSELQAIHQGHKMDVHSGSTTSLNPLNPQVLLQSYPGNIEASNPKS